MTQEKLTKKQKLEEAASKVLIKKDSSGDQILSESPQSTVPPAAKGLSEGASAQIKSVKVYSVKNDISVPDMINKHMNTFNHKEFSNFMMDQGQLIFESKSELSSVPTEKADGIYIVQFDTSPQTCRGFIIYGGELLFTTNLKAIEISDEMAISWLLKNLFTFLYNFNKTKHYHNKQNFFYKDVLSCYEKLSYVRVKYDIFLKFKDSFYIKTIRSNFDEDLDESLMIFCKLELAKSLDNMKLVDTQVEKIMQSGILEQVFENAKQYAYAVDTRSCDFPKKWDNDKVLNLKFGVSEIDIRENIRNHISVLHKEIYKALFFKKSS